VAPNWSIRSALVAIALARRERRIFFLGEISGALFGNERSKLVRRRQRPVAGAALHYPRRQGVGDAVADSRHVPPRIEGAFDVIGQALPRDDDEVRGWLAAAGAELAQLRLSVCQKIACGIGAENRAGRLIHRIMQISLTELCKARRMGKGKFSTTLHWGNGRWVVALYRDEKLVAAMSIEEWAGLDATSHVEYRPKRLPQWLVDRRA
jgi:hypothetical protein